MLKRGTPNREIPVVPSLNLALQGGSLLACLLAPFHGVLVGHAARTAAAVTLAHKGVFKAFLTGTCNDRLPSVVRL